MMQNTNRLKLGLCVIFLIFSSEIYAQKKHKSITGIYFQWGYNRGWFTKSNINFKMANGDRFTLHNTKAKDKFDIDAVIKKPLEISIPQYNYRLGFYINKNRTKSIEINFDHIKYVVTDGQKVRVTGTLDKMPVNGDSILNSKTFLHLEHTDGGNLLHINYVQQNTILQTAKKKRALINLIWKAGAGINIPRTDFTFRGDRLNNNFHIAGYNVSAEGGLRYFLLKDLFIETTAKSGYVRYVNALANTKSDKGNRVNHGFGYIEAIATIGFNIR